MLGALTGRRLAPLTAALLSIEVCCQEVYSSLGSQLAAETPGKYDITHRFDVIVPYIQAGWTKRNVPHGEIVYWQKSPRIFLGDESPCSKTVIQLIVLQ